jgi:poly-gamma-glutamate synthesis protein (capsule biosynthesis protein)
MSVANNHAVDYGPTVMNDTLLRLSKAGIQYCGAQQSIDGDIQNAVIFDDPRMKIAFLGFNDINKYPFSGYPRPWVASEETMIQSIKRARSQADIVVVNLHFGDEQNFTHSNRQEQLSHAAADAGADIIVGHHPHVIQDLEIYNSSIIAYSLGNFIFDMSGKGVREGAILTVEIDPRTKQITGHSFDKVTSNYDYQPRPGLIGMCISYFERIVTLSFSKINSIV